MASLHKKARPRGPIAWMAGNSVAANLVMVVLLVGGLIVAYTVKREVFPEFSLDIVTVEVEYPGASPEEVEEGIILAVEEAVQSLEGVDEIRSTAAEGRAMVTIEALEGSNVTRLWQEIKSEIDRITTFPLESEEPIVSIETRRREVLDVALHGVEDELVLREAAEAVRDELLRDPSITQVELEGARDYEIHIEISLASLRRYGLTLPEVAQAVATASVDLGGGSLRTAGGDVLVRIKDRRNSAEEYAALPLLTRADGGQVLLGDVADVSLGFEDSDFWATYNGKPSITLEIYRVGDQTPTEVSDAARRVIERLNQTLPGGLELSVARDSSDVFRQRADLLTRNAYIGLALVFGMLAVFLEIRLAFWVSMGIPISILGSFVLLGATDFSINMITMFAFIVTLGIVVDDAVVVGENIYNHRRKGLSPFDAALAGVREVAMPVTFSVLTNIVAFMPMLFIPGFMGKVFKFIPVVIICVFSISLIESLFVLPAHLAHSGKRNLHGPFGAIGRLQAAFSSRFERFVREDFGAFLDMTLKRRYLVISIGLALIIGVWGYVSSGRMGMELFPSVESDYAFVEAVLPAGASREEIKRVEKRLFEAGQDVIRENGGDRLSTGFITQVNEGAIEARLYLTDSETRPMGTTQVTELWRKAVGRIPGLESLTYQADRGGPGSGKALTIQLNHRDKELLEEAGRDLAASVAAFDGVSDVDDGSAAGKDQLDIRLLPAGERMGLTSREIASQVRGAFQGAIALRQQSGRNEVTVQVWLPEEERNSLATIENMVVTAPGGEILLKNAAEIIPSQAYTTINRVGGRRTVQVTANVTPRPRTEQILENVRADVLPQLLAKYPGLGFSFEGRQADTRESMQSLFRGMIVALLALYALLALPFRSYVQPAIIMFAIPFALVGAVFGHLIMGYSLSVMSMFGMVALMGVVINGSLVLIDFTNRNRSDGLSAFDAVHSAGVTRLRPILLTTLTTFGGLAPMIFETSRQARFLIPMAISLGYGLLFATFIVLFMVPAAYLILEDVKTLPARLRAGAVAPGQDRISES